MTTSSTEVCTPVVSKHSSTLDEEDYCPIIDSCLVLFSLPYDHEVACRTLDGDHYIGLRLLLCIPLRVLSMHGGIDWPKCLGVVSRAVSQPSP